MSTSTGRWIRVVTLGFGRSSLDLALVTALVATTGLAIVLQAHVFVRAPLAFVTVFVLPGYVATVVLFPGTTGSMAPKSTVANDGGGISLLDRAVLTVGLSLSLVVLVGIGVELAPVRIATQSLYQGVAALIVAMLPIGVYRRIQIPSEERFDPFAVMPTGRELITSLSALHVLVAMSVLFAGGAVAYAEVSNDAGGTTEFYFQNESDSETGLATYPLNMSQGQPENLTLAIGNHEGEQLTYRAVGELQRTDRRFGGTVVQDREEIYNGTFTVPPGDTQTFTSTVTPQETGDYRLTYLLYNSTRRSDPGEAYRKVYLQIEVDEPAADGET